MALAPGARLGPYAIEASIGAGGMGVVYKATDTRLHRTVAVKVLPDHLASNADLKRRFELEARSLAALNHPHICPVFDIGSHDSGDFLVMEYLEGETLEHRLTKGALPLDQAVRVGVEIAHALAAAHRVGITHRDLKPGNVMLTRSGAKLLDFGLAKLEAPISESIAVTRVAALTGEGTILGTLQYMAPEQLEAKPADARTDVFAFGAVMYEIVTGRKAFEGSSQAALIAAILDSRAPRIGAVNQDVPPFLEHVVRRCLAKGADDRWQSMHDVALALESLAGLDVAAPPSQGTTRRRPREWLGWAAAGATLVAATGFIWASSFHRGQQQTPVTRLSILPPERTTFLGGYSAPHLVLSPDGRRLAFVPTPIGGRALLWMRALDSVTSTPLMDTDGATFPFWSPDGRMLGFFADGKLKIVDPDGGAPRVIADAPDARGGAWGSDGVIVFSPQLVGPLYRVSVSGGEAAAATTIEPARQEISHRLPSFLPDGRHFLFLVQSGTESTSTVRIASLDSAETRPLAIVGSDAVHSQGFVLFRRDQSLMAQRFDPSRLQLAGEPVTLGDEVTSRNTVYGDTVLSAAQNGTLAYWNGQALLTNMTWFNRKGETLGTVPGGLGHYSLALSPDERTVAIEMVDEANQIGNLWMVDLASGIRSRFTSGAANWGPVWSPDGRRVVFGSLRSGPSSLYEKPARGVEAEQLLLQQADFIGVTDWSSDGRFILFQNLTRFKLGVMPFEGERTAKLLLQSEFVEGEGRLSPDRRWLAYTSNESGMWDVYVQPFPALDRKWRISPNGGTQPRWRADGREMYYVGPDQRLMAVPVTADAEFRAGVPAPLFQLRMIPFPPTQPRQQYAVTSNGERFLVNTLVEPPVPTPVTIVLNWPGALDN